MPKIERSNTKGKFSISELRAAVIESRAFWASPAGRAAAAKQERESRNRPATAGTPATAASRSYWQRRADRLEFSAPKI